MAAATRTRSRPGVGRTRRCHATAAHRRRDLAAIGISPWKRLRRRPRLLKGRHPKGRRSSGTLSRARRCCGNETIGSDAAGLPGIYYEGNGEGPPIVFARPGRQPDFLVAAERAFSARIPASSCPRGLHASSAGRGASAPEAYADDLWHGVDRRTENCRTCACGAVDGRMGPS